MCVIVSFCPVMNWCYPNPSQGSWVWFCCLFSLLILSHFLPAFSYFHNFLFLLEKKSGDRVHLLDYSCLLKWCSVFPLLPSVSVCACKQMWTGRHKKSQTQSWSSIHTCIHLHLQYTISLCNLRQHCSCLLRHCMCSRIKYSDSCQMASKHIDLHAQRGGQTG